MDWAALFDRAPTADQATIAAALPAAREKAASTTASGDTDAQITEPREPEPTRVVADADVLAADLLIGGPSRRALTGLWQHPWTTLVASDPLLSTAETVIATVVDDSLDDDSLDNDSLGDNSLAADWRDLIEAWCEPVVHPAGDHPALASAYRGGAMHVLSFDETLTDSGTAATLAGRFPVSVRSPGAFDQLFDPESLYATVDDGTYPGPQRPPRSTE